MKVLDGSESEKSCVRLAVIKFLESNFADRGRSPRDGGEEALRVKMQSADNFNILKSR